MAQHRNWLATGKPFRRFDHGPISATAGSVSKSSLASIPTRFVDAAGSGRGLVARLLLQPGETRGASDRIAAKQRRQGLIRLSAKTSAYSHRRWYSIFEPSR